MLKELELEISASTPKRRNGSPGPGTSRPKTSPETCRAIRQSSYRGSMP